MGVRIITDRQSDHPQAVLYCSTSDWAFGPVFSGNGKHDADERAEAFLRWLPQDARWFTDLELQEAYSKWLAQEDTQWDNEAAAEEEKENA
jgi:hypothetical protein